MVDAKWKSCSANSSQPSGIAECLIVHTHPEAFNLVNVSGGVEFFSTDNSQLFARLD